MSHRTLAQDYFKLGYNCAQSVVLAFRDVTGLSEGESARIASSFGGGFGRMREVCGAVSGMGIVAGILYGCDDPKDQAAKQAHYALVQEMAGKFREANGSIVCRELLGDKSAIRTAPDARTAEYYKKRPCVELVGMAADILDEVIAQRK